MKAPAALPKAPRLAAKSLDAAIAGDRPEAQSDGKTVDGLLAGYGKAYEDAREPAGQRDAGGAAQPALRPDAAHPRRRRHRHPARPRRRRQLHPGVPGAGRRRSSASSRTRSPTLSKDLGWSPKTAKRWYSREDGKESAALVSLTDRLLAGIDSVLAVLSAEAGAYKLVDGKIRFEDLTAARQYGELRRNINAAVDSARIAGGEESAGPMGYLLKAIGTTRLPQES